MTTESNRHEGAHEKDESRKDSRQLTDRRRTVLFYIACAIPVLCLVLGITTSYSWKILNGVGVAGLLLIMWIKMRRVAYRCPQCGGALEIVPDSEPHAYKCTKCKVDWETRFGE